MNSYSEIIRVWSDPNNSEQQLCVSAFPDSQTVIDLVVNYNPALTELQFIQMLKDNNVQYRGVWERPKQRPRN